MNDYEIMRVIDSFQHGNFRSTLFKTDADWLNARTKTIGASDAAAVMGISPWLNEVELWEEKRTGKRRPFSGNADTKRGHESESHIRDLYAIEMGVDVLDGTRKQLVSLKYPFMSCTLDGIIITNGKPVILEIKSVKYSHGEWSDDKIPDYYFLQLLHQLSVTGWDEAILLVRFARNPDWEGASERVYHVRREDVQDQIEKLVRKEDAFWTNNVVGGKRPPVRMPVI